MVTVPGGAVSQGEVFADDLAFISDFLSELGIDDSSGFVSVASGDSVTLTTDDNAVLGPGAVGATGNDNANVIAGNDGNNVVSGGGGDDGIAAGGGDDTVDGGTGGDQVRGGEGNDSAVGGEGNDIVLGNQGDDSATGGAGDDIVHGGQGNDTVSSFGADTLYGGKGDDVVTSDGGIAYGNQGADSVSGSGGNEVLFGGQGSDTILGGSGDDEIHGNAGDDTLDGGVGNDNFVYLRATDGSDLIQNFDLANDTVSISSSLVPGVTSAADLISNVSSNADGDAQITLQSGVTITFEGITDNDLVANIESIITII